jgi:hypothetical protein
MFKNILLTALLLAIFGVKQNYLHSQVFFTQTFEGTMGANGIPTGWSETGLSTDGIYTVGTNANATSAYVTFPAAIQGTKFAYTNDDACNCDKSVDRLILPVQTFAGMAGVTMIYDVFNDGLYGGIATVEVSTVGTAGPWTTISTIPTNAAWQNDISLNLGAYAGQSNIFISFRYNDAAGWAGAFGVDEVRLQQLTVLTPEVSVVSVTPSEYTLIPKDQVSSFPISATITNTGTGSAASVTLTTSVFKLPNTTTPVYIGTGSIANLAAGASATINASTAFTPSFPTTGDYIFQNVISGNTGSITNDTLIYGTSIVQSTYARDNGTAVQGIGAGSGTKVIVGNNFAINTPTTLDSVLFFLYPGAPGLGDTVHVRIRNTVGGVPVNGADVAFSAPYVLTVQDTSGALLTLDVINASATPVILTAGTYFVGIEKSTTGDNYGLQCSNTIFTQNTVYANINNGAFSPLNSLLAGFNFTPIIRPIFENCSTTATATHVACGSFTWLDGQTYTSNNNTATYTIPSVEGCDSIITLNLTINPVSNPAFNYASNTICTTGSNPTATTSSTGQFTSTAGLIFANATTGEIDLATSQSGTYTITYTTTGLCPATSSQTITLTSSPSASFNYDNTNYCSGASNPQITFSNGASAGVFTAVPAGLVINPTSGAIDLVNSLPNLYTVSNTIAASGACPQTSATTNITVTAPILGNFSYDNAAYCIDANNPQLTLGNGASAGVFTAVPAGLVINPTSGAIDLVNSLPNLYTVSNTIAASGVCPQTSSTTSVTVNALPQVGLTLVDDVVCIDLATVNLQGGTPINGVYSGNNVTGNTFNMSTIGFTDITYTYTDVNGCSNSAVASIEVVDCANLEELANGNGIICYPNPADQQFTIEFLQPNGQDVQIEIINGMGQLIQNVEHSSIENNKITVYTENLATGLYTVRVRSGNELMTKLIQKM